MIQSRQGLLNRLNNLEVEEVGVVKEGKEHLNQHMSQRRLR